jgi:hypothetical protein
MVSARSIWSQLPAKFPLIGLSSVFRPAEYCTSLAACGR